MTKEKIQEAYEIASEYLLDPFIEDKNNIKDLVQIGIQMALNGEVLYNEDGTVNRVE